MPAPVLSTKLYIPPIRPNAVSRLRLIERLNGGLRATHGVTLISAPAGFGKTSLISEWLASEWIRACNLPAAWLSLDEGDNDPTRFLTYLVAAFQTLAQKNGEAPIGAGALALLQSSQPPAPESILTTLINELSSISVNFILVLDDYHVIDSQAVDQALTFLVEYQPRSMHLVIATREDPPLPLARMRARGQLTELRAVDLRFTPTEAAEFLNQVMGLSLSAEDIATLERRTEGWIAGCSWSRYRCRTVRIPGALFSPSPAVIVLCWTIWSKRFCAGSRNMSADFLLQTSILDRLCGALCNALCSAGTPCSYGTAITDREDGKAMLETLEHGNLFVIPLDDQRQWYRYHHLFAEVLQTYLDEAYSDRIAHAPPAGECLVRAE